MILSLIRQETDTPDNFSLLAAIGIGISTLLLTEVQSRSFAGEAGTLANNKYNNNHK